MDEQAIRADERAKVAREIVEHLRDLAASNLQFGSGACGAAVSIAFHDMAAEIELDFAAPKPTCPDCRAPNGWCVCHPNPAGGQLISAKPIKPEGE